MSKKYVEKERTNTIIKWNEYEKKGRRKAINKKLSNIEWDKKEERKERKTAEYIIPKLRRYKSL